MKMTVAIVDLLKPIEIADKNCQWRLCSFAPTYLVVQMEEQGPCIRKSSEVIGCGGNLGQFIFQCIFDGEAKLGTSG